MIKKTARNERIRIIGISMAILVIAVIVISVSWTYQLYDSTLKRSRQHLKGVIQSQVSLIEAVAAFDAEHSQSDHPEGSTGATLQQVRDAYQKVRNFGETGELVVGKLDPAGHVVFLQEQRRAAPMLPMHLEDEPSKAEPMRLALQGYSGSIIGIDYRGKEVLAAYAPIPSLSIGLVAKMETAEIRKPFLAAMWKTGLVAALVLLTGGIIIYFSLNQLVRRVEDRELQATQSAKRLQMEQTYSDLMNRLLKKVMLITNNASTTEDVFLQGIREICKVMDWSVGHVYLRSAQDPNMMEPSSLWFRNNATQIESFVQSTMNLTFPKGIGLPGRALEIRKPVWIRDVTIDKNFPRSASIESHEIKGGIGIPILVEQEVYAVMEFFTPEPLGEIDEKLMEIFSYLGILFGKIIERTQTESELHDLYVYHHLILNSVAEGIVGLGTDGVVTFINEAGAHQLGYECQECIGKPFQQTFLSIENLDNPLKYTDVSKVYTEGLFQQSSGDIFCQKNGTVIPVEYTGSPVRDGKGTVQGGVLLFKDITERLQREHEKKTLQDQLLRATHEAGKSEIATGILHNVGNVLNSTNISATTLSDEIAKLDVESFVGVTDLFTQHAEDLPQYLTADPTGKQIPEFLLELAKKFTSDRQVMQQEMDFLRKHLEHIRSIIGAQQKYAKSSSLIQSVNVSELIQDALDITSMSRAPIVVDCSIEPDVIVQTDRHKILQILVNLFNNARQAVLDSSQECPSLRIIVDNEEDFIRIHVTDNGSGIAQEHLEQIFEYGFTTKPDGHGYGLHTAVLDAKNLGGSLEANSPGLKQGSTFSLTIPKVRVAELVS